jgi:hypothetical protein
VTLTPRAVVVYRHSELDELIARHGTRGQAAFFLSSRGRTIDEVEARDAAQRHALAAVSAVIPLDWRRGRVERADLDRFVFGPEDVIVPVGQDGLVANVAKYLDGQPVIGVNPEPDRNPGVLVRHAPDVLERLLAGPGELENRTMVEVSTDDGQSLLALNEVYIGQPGHQSARYRITTAAGHHERQSSSGVLIGSGTGATGWCRSVWRERGRAWPLPAPTEPRLCWFVREAWPSPATGTELTEGTLAAAEELVVVAESDLVAFGDGIESDTIALTWGQRATVSMSSRTLRLVVD